MIKKIKHKGLARFFFDNVRSGLDTRFLPKISRILDVLDMAQSPEDVNIPGWRLHPLIGDRIGYWSVTVSANWRITFTFEADNVTDVNLEDYH